jgi:hypothetical protein
VLQGQCPRHQQQPVAACIFPVDARGLAQYSAAGSQLQRFCDSKAWTASVCCSCSTSLAELQHSCTVSCCSVNFHQPCVFASTGRVGAWHACVRQDSKLLCTFTLAVVLHSFKTSWIASSCMCAACVWHSPPCALQYSVPFFNDIKGSCCQYTKHHWVYLFAALSAFM